MIIAFVGLLCVSAGVGCLNVRKIFAGVILVACGAALVGAAVAGAEMSR